MDDGYSLSLREGQGEGKPGDDNARAGAHGYSRSLPPGLGGRVKLNRFFEPRSGGQKYYVQNTLETRNEMGCTFATDSGFGFAHGMKIVVLLIVVAVIGGVDCGCASRLHTAAFHNAAKETFEPERSLRMLIYSRALSDSVIFPYRDRICYLAENDQFIEELKHTTGIHNFKSFSPLVLKRMRAGICEEPGFCFSITFAEIAETKATADLFWMFPKKDAGGGQETRFELEKRDGTWIISKSELRSRFASLHPPLTSRIARSCPC